ncbi:fungal-specific transcription factor domain-containing protein [Podospora didyma]|uniref:Fungal-specific transcription factor domain-containing protein n=1 Tax=Podospora didyma TaxID=330526 RepID=A0AAE0KD02_9PEZI|nr:fungal-specific transcription factor domain-containing protein [Podospora didyma]
MSMTAPRPARAGVLQPGKKLRCHNCRRRRLRCDQSYPTCHKCSISGEECLGYGIMLRWANAPAIKGKLAGQTLALKESGRQTNPTYQTTALSWAQNPISINLSLVDPLLSHLNKDHRRYINHFTTVVCRDLVSLDQDDKNPFRAMVSLIGKFDYLEAVIVATSAMHLTTLNRYRGLPPGPELVDSLVSKDRAIRLLKSAIDQGSPTNQAMVLAAIVFFVNLDLIDSGKGGWKIHIDAAGSLISSLQERGPKNLGLDSTIAALADAMAADCLTYRIMASTITCAGSMAGFIQEHVDVCAVLQRAEAHSYHCCPPLILQIILSSGLLFVPPTTPQAHPHQQQEVRMEGYSSVTEMALSLLDQVRSFDIIGWVHSIRGLSPNDDLEARVHVAAAHRAAACLYLLLTVPEAQIVPSSPQLDDLVAEIVYHLSSIDVGHVLLKGTIWPTFMAGAQTDDLAQREWCASRLFAVWAENPWVCPWGYVDSAMQMLRDIWTWRDNRPGEEALSMNWLQELKSGVHSDSDCLIV